MKPSGAGQYWAREEYDPEYTTSRDVSPKRSGLQKHKHVSDRRRASLRSVWGQDESQTMSSLIDGGFLTDFCLDKDGRDLKCPGTLNVQYYESEGQHNRKLYCSGVPEKHRHRMHWLSGSIFQGHARLDAKDVTGVLSCLASSKSAEQIAMDTGLNRNTCRHMLDRLRMAATLAAQAHAGPYFPLFLYFFNHFLETVKTALFAEKDMQRTGAR